MTGGAPEGRNEAPAIVLDLGLSRDGFVQPLAGESLWCDLELAAGAIPARRPVLGKTGEGGTESLVYDGPGLVGGRTERVRATLSEEGTRTVAFGSGDGFRVSGDGAWVARTADSPDGTPAERRLELAVGAPLALALAIRGTHLLHAAAVEGTGGVAALAGESGVGKSTLAAAAAHRPEFGLARVADDILPVRLGSEPLSFPHFPQLKLPLNEAWPAAGAVRVPLAALVCLERRKEGTPVVAERLSGAAAAAELVRAGVATRLLDRGLLEAHLESCTRAAARLPVWRLRFASGERGLGDALERLAGLARGAENG